MTPEQIPERLSATQAEAAHQWWNALSLDWKQAFNEVILGQSTPHTPDDRTLFTMQHLEAVRFAGPRAPFPNMSFALDNLSGLRDLPDVRIVIVNHHEIRHLHELRQIVQIQSLFVVDNQLTSLAGIETLKDLKELYCSVNEVDSLLPLSALTELHTLYCNNNKLVSLDGIGAQHRTKLRQFVCLPNEGLPDTEVIRMEREIGIRCLKG